MLAEGIKFQYVTKVHLEPWNPKTESNFQLGIILSVGSVLPQAQWLRNEKPQAAIVQSLGLPMWDDVVLTLLLPWR